LLDVRQRKTVLLRDLVEGAIVHAKAETAIGLEGEEDRGAVWGFAGADHAGLDHGGDVLKEKLGFDWGCGLGALIRWA